MRTCFVVPGILGSEMYIPGAMGPGLLWVNFPALCEGWFVALTLAADGVSPDPELGQAATPGAPLDNYYGPLIGRLRRDLDGDDWQVVGFGYDWRKDIFHQGEKLAEAILAASTPAAVVAHSQGGLVARCAYAVLSAAGNAGRMARLVTLGTPHRGSYAPAAVFSMEEELLEQLAALQNAVAAVLVGWSGFIPPPYVSALDTEHVAATWPAMYQLLPIIDAGSKAGDPDRPALYSAANWPKERNVAQKHLDYARTLWHDFLRSPVSMPPYEVLTCVAGVGRRTPFYLQAPEVLGDISAFGWTDTGDGRVAADSSLLPGLATNYAIPSGHGELQLQPRLLDRIARLVTEVKAPPPAPPPEVDLNYAVSIAAGPPMFVISRQDGDC